jgi:hypothetical protein
MAWKEATANDLEAGIADLERARECGIEIGRREMQQEIAHWLRQGKDLPVRSPWRSPLGALVDTAISQFTVRLADIVLDWENR